VDKMASYASDVAFTPSVKAVQTRKGSRRSYERMEERGSWQTRITPDLARFIEAQTSIFLGTANRDGQPYIQHRGGPPGFLQVLDDKTIGFADFSGNRQYITQGNLADNPKAYLFLIDYARRQRIKIWGEARVIEGDAELTAKLMPEGYKARAEQVVFFTVAAWDANCPQHIPQRFEADDVAAGLAERDRRIAMLEGEIERLRGDRSRKVDSTRFFRAQYAREKILADAETIATKALREMVLGKLVSCS
jgi:predicted pyridoxine 5'-phosphate oxidase superfamily flavin-nucleotide-binding protein